MFLVDLTTVHHQINSYLDVLVFELDFGDNEDAGDDDGLTLLNHSMVYLSNDLHADGRLPFVGLGL